MTLHHPLPIVGQNRVLLPDGKIDPAHASDCGESCVSCVALGAGLGFWSPGCIRQWLGLPLNDGRTTAEDLQNVLQALALSASVHASLFNAAKPTIETAGHDGGACLLLGTWVQAPFEHWVVSGKTTDGGVWVMDPWAGAHLFKSWAEVGVHYSGQLVRIHG